MLNSLKAKITAGVVISNNSKNKTESRPAYSTPANVSKPAASNADPAASAAFDESLYVESNGKMVEGDFEFDIYKKDGKPTPTTFRLRSFLGATAK